MTEKEDSDEVIELAADLERSHREAEFWWETSISLVRSVVQHQGVDVAEVVLEEAVKALGRSAGRMNPAHEAARLLIDDYRQRVLRIEAEIQKRFERVAACQMDAGNSPEKEG